ncbi:hypothetical protein [Tenacibaculum caenipelagi]|uniref:ParB-like nuclease family protein n=1 Tax=Tenacibaculum caenipelagi TaxID=1325435 RepID=A0A4R6TE45_9FLAO|nr:hypothetical protein [Tenacibaculum caenipelagi]TDQ27643.1 hypothetical protein DFQ07_1494 [Tenacibaculum caenipelagi]
MNNIPTVPIEKVSLEENYYEDTDGYVYSATKLIEHSKQYPIFDMPLSGIDLRRSTWEINDLDDFIHHAKRCTDTDLKHPIILDRYGTIADGCHRVVKAIVLGKRTIKAIRLETMPPYDRIEKNSQKNE